MPSHKKNNINKIPQNLPYNDRLHELGTLTLSNRRTLTDLITVYKCLHGFINCLPSEVGLETATSSTKGCGIRLKQQHPVNRSCANFFPFRGASKVIIAKLVIITLGHPPGTSSRCNC